jgi:hypothetical protein
MTVGLASASVFAQSGDSTTRSTNPVGGLGGTLLLWWICARRKKEEIGGWLLLFYIQMYAGALVTLIFTLVSISNYSPTSWTEAPTLYPLFLLSAVPGIVLRFVELVVAERARRARSWKLVRRLRMVLWIDISAAVLGALIDASYFPDNLPLSILAIGWPLVWLPYFYVSKRVRGVFVTKDWLVAASAEPTPATNPAAHVPAQVPIPSTGGDPMKCAACGATVTLTARFCSSCGQPVSDPTDSKSPSEVTIPWLTSLLEGQGYQVKGQDGTPNGLFARHDSRPNLLLELRTEAKVITLQSIWSIKKPGWMQKADFLAALNKANGTDWFCTCYAPDALDSLLVSSFIYLTDRLSARDVAVFLEMFSTGAHRAIERSGMAKFG